MIVEWHVDSNLEWLLFFGVLLGLTLYFVGGTMFVVIELINWRRRNRDEGR